MLILSAQKPLIDHLEPIGQPPTGAKMAAALIFMPLPQSGRELSLSETFAAFGLAFSAPGFCIQTDTAHTE